MISESRLMEIAEIGHDAYEAKAREMGHVSGSPVPWSDVPEPYRSCTLAAYAAVVEDVLEEEGTASYQDGYSDGVDQGHYEADRDRDDDE